MAAGPTPVAPVEDEELYRSNPTGMRLVESEIPPFAATTFARITAKSTKHRVKGNESYERATKATDEKERVAALADAYGHYGQALRLDPYLAPVFSNRALVLLESKRPYQSLIDARCSTAVNNRWSKAHARKAAALHALGGGGEAAMALNRAIQVAETDGEREGYMHQMTQLGQAPRATNVATEQSERDQDFFTLLGALPGPFLVMVANMADVVGGATSTEVTTSTPAPGQPKKGALTVASMPNEADASRVMPPVHRGLFSTTARPLDSLVFVEEPLHSYPQGLHTYEARCCDYCLKPGASLACPTCYVPPVLYCSDECRMFAWLTHHAAICGNKRLRVAAADPSMMLLLRVLANVALDELNNRTIGILDHIGRMVACPLEQCYEEYRDVVHAESFEQYQAKLREWFDEVKEELLPSAAREGSHLTYELLVHIVGALRWNAVTGVVNTPAGPPCEGKLLAYVSLTPLLTYANHSCLPNISYITSPGVGNKICVVTGSDVMRGEEMCLDYIGCKDMPFAERQALLKRRYGFTCVCQKCMVESEEGWKDLSLGKGAQ